MKIILSSSDKDIKNSVVSEMFGRCPYFFIVEIEDKKIKGFKAMENPNINQTSSAGIATAQMVAEKNISAVITGTIGPRASEIFKQFNIQVYKGTGSINEAIQNFIEEKLVLIE